MCLTTVLGCSFFRSDNGSNAVSNVGSANNSNNASTTAGPAAGSAESRSAEAEALVADLYRQHDAKKGPFFQTADRHRVDKYFTRSTADLIWKDSTSSKGEIGAIDFDPLYDTQDVDKKNFSIGGATVNGDRATVVASYTNFGEKKRIVFALKFADSDWKIEDIRYDAGHTLLGLLRETYANTSGNAPPVKNVSGEFEGTYRVGDTTCTVRPDRQAFEVRWAKGSGSEYYFYKDANVFESEEVKGGGRNEFRFNDQNYNSGTFYRPDGKTFAVSRAR
jgi:hypothetical protein